MRSASTGSVSSKEAFLRCCQMCPYIESILCSKIIAKNYEKQSFNFNESQIFSLDNRTQADYLDGLNWLQSAGTKHFGVSYFGKDKHESFALLFPCPLNELQCECLCFPLSWQTAQIMDLVLDGIIILSNQKEGMKID